MKLKTKVKQNSTNINLLVSVEASTLKTSGSLPSGPDLSEQADTPGGDNILVTSSHPHISRLYWGTENCWDGGSRENTA